MGEKGTHFAVVLSSVIPLSLNALSTCILCLLVNSALGSPHFSTPELIYCDDMIPIRSPKVVPVQKENV